MRSVRYSVRAPKRGITNRVWVKLSARGDATWSRVLDRVMSIRGAVWVRVTDRVLFYLIGMGL